MIIGFTGTKEGMRPLQKVLFEIALSKRNPSIFAHGDCTGADHDAHEIARKLGVEKIHIFPPKNPKHRAYCDGDYLFPEEEYFDRNKKIVEYSDELIAVPKGMVEELRSGTWSTIRYARKQNALITIIYPNGSVVVEKGKQKLSAIFNH